MAKNYSRQEISEFNLLEILEIERSKTNLGITWSKLCSLSENFDRKTSLAGAIQLSKERGLILEELSQYRGQIYSITKKGRAELTNFFSGATSKNLEEFQKQR